MSKMNINQCTVTLTRKCNLRCEFLLCQKNRIYGNDTIEYDNLKRIVDFCNDGKVKYIFFTGGEPHAISISYRHFRIY